MMRLKLLLMGFVSLLVLTGVSMGTAFSGSASAAVDPNCIKGGFLGIDPWYKYLDVGEHDLDGDGTIDAQCAIKGPLASDGNLDWAKIVPRALVAALEILMRIAAVVAVGFTIYGGFMYIISQGEPDATKKAKGTIVGASVGVVIAIFASYIVGFIGGILWF